LGRGSLSDVEWTVQLMQLEHGHELAGLRTTSTLGALEAATEAGLLSAEDSAQLAAAWTMATEVRSAVMLFRGRTAEALPVAPPACSAMRRAPAMISRTTICARPGTPAPSWSSASTDSEPAGAAAVSPRSGPAGGPSGPSVGEFESEQAVLDHFGQRGMDPVLPGGDLIGSLPERHGLDERLDEHRCLMPDDMRPEQQSAVPVGD